MFSEDKKMNDRNYEVISGIIHYHNLEFHPNTYGPSEDGRSTRQGVGIWSGQRRLGAIIIDPSNSSIEDTLNQDPAFDPVRHAIIALLKKTGNAYALGSVFFRS